MTKYEEYVQKKIRAYGDRFSADNLDARFIRYFNSGERIKVVTLGMTLTGTVGVTTGWKPRFLLMRTRRSRGSSWTLGSRDTIHARKVGRTYVATYRENAHDVPVDQKNAAN